MARAPFQVLVFPWFAERDEKPLFAVFHRKGNGAWQGIAGGGEDDEAPEDAARREAAEEAGIADEAAFLRLDSVASIPAVEFSAHRSWGPNVYVIPEYSFGVRVPHKCLALSSEHDTYKWLAFRDACKRLSWDSNRTALWELNERISKSPGC